MFKKILVPVDFSESSTLALDTAVALAKDNDASLTIVHVYEPLAIAVPEGYQLFTEEQLTRMLEEFHRELTEQRRRAELAGAQRVDTELLHGFAVSEIQNFAQQCKFDLIVMGTHGRRGLSHAFLGSVAERVVRSAPCPVLTVRAPRAAAEKREPA
ncbi:MAG TPA: universal stress protein [Polyangiaceae bacterium]|nr:universal stress protein [Polyangiaceae bacterium]